jgi:carbamoylphosphate synthase large subunit
VDYTSSSPAITLSRKVGGFPIKRGYKELIYGWTLSGSSNPVKKSFTPFKMEK